MSNEERRKAQRASSRPEGATEGAFTVEIDPRLLDEALAVVSEPVRRAPEPAQKARTGRPVPANLRGMPVAAAPTRPPPRAAPRVTTTPAPPPVDLDDVPTVENFAADAPPQPQNEQAAPAPSRHEPETLGRPTDFFQLRLELERTRGERDDARSRLETETRERLRLVGRLKRATDDVERLTTALTSAEDARSKAEVVASAAKDAARSSQDAVERVRERGRRAEEEYRKSSAVPLLAELLPTLENLERALHTSRNHPDQLASGLEIVVSQFQAALGRVGVERIDSSPGTIFQPALHEAVLYVAVYDAPPGTIVSEMQPGYLWQGKLVRAARVSVAAPPQQAQLSLDQVEQRRARSALSEGEALSLPSDDVSQDADREDVEDDWAPADEENED